MYACKTEIQNLPAHLPNPEKNFADSLEKYANNHADPALLDSALFNQDKEFYLNNRSVFQAFPLHKSPFPVAEYDYAVISQPLSIDTGAYMLKGVSIGEYSSPDSEKVNYKMTIIALTKDQKIEENTLVESRNYPYLTAQGTITLPQTDFDWVYAGSPDGFSVLLVNMKMFDLRFGETIIIYPQNDHSFHYEQCKISPNDYLDYNEFEQEVLKISNVQKLIAKPLQ